MKNLRSLGKAIGSMVGSRVDSRVVLLDRLEARVMRDESRFKFPTLLARLLGRGGNEGPLSLSRLSGMARCSPTSA